MVDVMRMERLLQKGVRTLSLEELEYCAQYSPELIDNIDWVGKSLELSRIAKEELWRRAAIQDRQNDIELQERRHAEVLALSASQLEHAKMSLRSQRNVSILAAIISLASAIAAWTAIVYQPASVPQYLPTQKPLIQPPLPKKDIKASPISDEPSKPSAKPPLQITAPALPKE